MKAAIRTHYGPPRVIEVVDIDKPVPADNQVLVKVHAASLNKADMYDLHPPFIIRLIMGGGIIRPKVSSLGRDLSGRVESVGREVTKFKVGDDVFGCGPAALAEYAVAREDRLTLKPPGVSFEDCAASPVAGVTALQGLRKGKIQAGQKVLIDGTSGGVGTFALQIAKSMGAEVTAVCSTQNVPNAKNMGADQVIDYTQTDFTKAGVRYDLILGVNGFHSISSIRRALKPEGTFMLIGSSRVLTDLLQTVLLGRFGSGKKKIGFLGVAKIIPEDLATLGELMDSGKLKPLIDGRYSLAETSRAFAYLGEGHAKGKAVITLQNA